MLKSWLRCVVCGTGRPCAPERFAMLVPYSCPECDVARATKLPLHERKLLDAKRRYGLVPDSGKES